MKGIEELKAMMRQSEYVFRTFRCWKIDFSQWSLLCISKLRQYQRQARATHDDFAEMYDLSFDG
jgi:hypothetical protein